MSKYDDRSFHLVQDTRVYRPADDPYVENYEEIATAHMKSQDVGQRNPFIEEQVWTDLEANTISLIAKHARAGQSILDIGVGTGRLLAHFPLLERYGLDISLTYVSRLKESRIEACVGAIEDLPYLSDSFDFVVCTDVLEHVLDLHKAYCEIKRVVRPGGTIIIRVPYREDLSAYLAPEYPYRFAHVRAFDEYELRIQLERVYELEALDERYDRAYSAARFFLPLWRGRTLLTRMIEWAAHQTGLRQLALRLYRPVTITVAYRKPVQAL